jgi:arylsulfatase A-like enzyme
VNPKLASVRAVPAIALCAVLFGSCGTPPQPHRGPVVLITIDALRADVVGALGGRPGLTPHLDRLAAESDWAERSIAASSWTVPSMASLFTGLQPWRHGNWHADRARLAEELVTLPEALQDSGYRTFAFRSNTWLRPQFGYAQGFEVFQSLGQGKRAEAKLESLTGEPDFVWVHVLPPHAPYQRWAHLLDRLPEGAPADLPERVRAAELERYFDPAATPAPEDLARFWALYQLHVAHADEVVGRLLDALRRSGRWEEAMVVVTSDHGEEFAENGQIAHGGNLHRVLVEVPLLVKLPAGSERELTPRAGVANHRIYATVLELCGVDPSANGDGVLPSLFEPTDPPALSELYYGNGVNSFSLVEQERQVVVTSPFATREPGYFAARRQALGLPDGLADEEPAALFARLRAAFLTSPPLRGVGGSEPLVALARWAADHEGSPLEEVEAAAEAGERFRRVAEEWERWNGEEVVPASLAPPAEVELSPAEREQLEALGYVVGER